MKTAWFRRMGWIWRPVSIEGWFVTLLAFAIAAWWFVAIDRRSHSVSDTLIGFWPYGAPLALVWGFAASRTDGESDRSR